MNIPLKKKMLLNRKCGYKGLTEEIHKRLKREHRARGEPRLKLKYEENVINKIYPWNLRYA